MSEKPSLRMTNNAELKHIVKGLGDLAAIVADGITVSDIWAGYKVSAELEEVLKNKALLFPEWTKLDDEARADLVKYAQENVKIPANMKVEDYLEKILASAIALSAVVAPWLA